MGFNAVLAAAGGARNYMARRQVDKRVSLLCHFDGNGLDSSAYNNSVINSSVLYRTGGVYGQQCASGPTEGSLLSISMNCLGLDWAGDWTISFWYSTRAIFTGQTFRIIVGGTEIVMHGTDTCNYYANGAAYVLPNRTVDGVFRQFVGSRKDGVVSWYLNGSRKCYASDTANLTGSKIVQVNLQRGPDSINELRILSGVGYSGATIALQSAPYTGYEAL